MAALVTDSGRKTPARLAGSAILACQSDERLVSMVRDGHERAFEAIVDRYRRPLLRRCRRILPESRAEDAVQQTFLNAHTSLTDSDEAVNLKPWLYAIARNVSLNMLRQNGWNYEQIPAEFDGVRRPDQVFEQRAAIEQTVHAMNELPERQRSALVMRELEGRSYAEIAAVLGTGDGAVRQLLNRARAALRTAATAVMPPPLVARIVTSPPDGRRVAEVIGGLGAAGVAKAGAAALIAGSLVVGAVEAPLPLGQHDKPARERATLAHRGAPGKAAAPLATAPVARTVHRSAPLATATPQPTHSGGSSGPGPSQRSGSSGSERSGSDDRHEAEHRSGSDDGARSEPRSGSDDDTRTRSGSGTSGTTETAEAPSPNSGPGGGSDDALTGGGSDDVVASTEPDNSGSGSSGSGRSGSSGSDSSGPGSGGSDDPTPELSSGE